MNKPAAPTAVVFAGGDPVDPKRLKPLPPGALLIAADGGLDQARLLGVEVDAIVGDMDSVDKDALDAALAAGGTAERHPPDKDATDLELALDYATRRGCTRIIVIGGLGGRIDHLLGNALLLAAAETTTIEWWAESADIAFAHPGLPRRAPATPGDVVSLIPVGGAAVGIETKGLRWHLDHETLEPGSSRGISNVADSAEYSVVVESGSLLIIHHTEGSVR
jgi:thiamine pyrophosphokinase